MSGDELTVTPSDLTRLAGAFAEASAALPVVSDLAQPSTGSFGAVTHSALIAELATRLAGTDLPDRLRSSLTESDYLVDALTSAARSYADTDETSAAQVRDSVSPRPQG
jgi:hypothetical protein